MLFMAISAVQIIFMVKPVMRIHFIFIKMGSPFGDFLVVTMASQAFFLAKRFNFLCILKVAMASHTIKTKLFMGVIF